MRTIDVLYHIVQARALMQSPLITEFNRLEQRYPFNLDIYPCRRAICISWHILREDIKAMSQEEHREHN